MRTRFSSGLVGVMALAALSLAGIAPVSAQISVAQSTSSNVQPASVRLSPGVPDILKLSEARVGDDAVVAYVNGTGLTYNLSVNEIIYLKSQGLSDRVLTAMLNQNSRPGPTPPQPAQPAPSAAPPATAPTPAATAPPPQASASTSVYANAPGTEFAPAASQQTAYAQAAPATTVYAVPSAPTYAYPAYYPYYPYYSYPAYSYGYSYPSVSLGVGVGFGGWGGGCYRGWGGWGGYRGGCGIGVGIGLGVGVGFGWGGYCR